MDNKRSLMYTIKQLDKEWIKYLKRTSGELGISDTFRQIIMYLSKNPGANQKNIAGFFNMTGAGKVTVSYGDKHCGTVDLVAINDVERDIWMYRMEQVKAFFGKIWVKVVLIALAVLIVLVIVLRIVTVRRRRRRRNYSYHYRGRRR